LREPKTPTSSEVAKKRPKNEIASLLTKRDTKGDHSRHSLNVSVGRKKGGEEGRARKRGA